MPACVSMLILYGYIELIVVVQVYGMLAPFVRTYGVVHGHCGAAVKPTEGPVKL